MKTKNTLRKRIMSFALVLCMVIAFIPAMPAEYAQAADGTIVYDFTELVSSNTSIVEYGSKITNNFEKFDTFDEVSTLVNSTNNGSWRISDASITNSSGKKSFIRVAQSYIQQKIYYEDTGSVTIGIKVDEAGWYSATTNVKVYDDEEKNDGEEIPITISVNDIANEYKVEDSTSAFEPLGLGQYYLEAGTEYKVVYSITGNEITTDGDPDETQFLITNLTLTQQTPELSVNDENLPKAMLSGNSADLPTVAENVTVGTSQYPVNVKFESTDEDVICVGDGIITAKGAGVAKITMTATYDTDKEITDEWWIVVREAATAGVISYRMDGQVHTTNGDARTRLADVPSGTEYTDGAYGTAWTYVGYTSSRGDHELRSDNGLGLKLSKGTKNNGTITIELDVKEAGWYSVAVDLRINFPDVTTATFTVKDPDSNELLRKEIRNDVNTFTVTELGTVNFPKAGDYTVEFKAEIVDNEADSTIWNWLRAITLTETVEKNEIFGSKYAYVKKNADSTYNVSFIGGLHAIEGFEAAGFEVWQDGAQVAEAKTQLAYKQITYILNSQTETKKPSDYGVSEDTGYIFLETANAVDGGTAYAFETGTYTIKPYVIEGGEKKYYEIDLSLVIG